MMHPYVGIGAGLVIASFAVSAVLTGLVRRWAVRADFVARPAADRYHRTVVPLGGGIAIFWTITGFLLAAAVGVRLGAAGWFGPDVAVHAAGFRDRTPELLVVIGVLLGLHLVGLWDDRRHLGAGFKLVVQFLAAAVAAVFADVRVELFLENRAVAVVLSVFWIVLVMNSFNFLDNMDGLSAGIACIVAAVLFAAAAMAGQVFVGAMGLLFIGALLGFLAHNFPPARIFMGDSGSLVIGFLVALLTLRTTYYHEAVGGGLYAVFMPVVVLAVPLYDFATVTFLRLSQGRSPFVGDTQHFSHRMRRRGLSDRQTVLTLYLTTVCTGTGALLLHWVGWVGAVLVVMQMFMILAIIAILEATGKPAS